MGICTGFASQDLVRRYAHAVVCRSNLPCHAAFYPPPSTLSCSPPSTLILPPSPIRPAHSLQPLGSLVVVAAVPPALTGYLVCSTRLGEPGVSGAPIFTIGFARGSSSLSGSGSGSSSSGSGGSGRSSSDGGGSSTVAGEGSGSAGDGTGDEGEGGSGGAATGEGGQGGGGGQGGVVVQCLRGQNSFGVSGAREREWARMPGRVGALGRAGGIHANGFVL